MVRISCIQSESRKIRIRKNSVFGQFSRSAVYFQFSDFYGDGSRPFTLILQRWLKWKIWVCAVVVTRGLDVHDVWIYFYFRPKKLSKFKSRNLFKYSRQTSMVKSPLFKKTEEWSIDSGNFLKFSQTETDGKLRNLFENLCCLFSLYLFQLICTFLPMYTFYWNIKSAAWKRKLPRPSPTYILQKKSFHTLKAFTRLFYKQGFTKVILCYLTIVSFPPKSETCLSYYYCTELVIFLFWKAVVT